MSVKESLACRVDYVEFLMENHSGIVEWRMFRGPCGGGGDVFAIDVKETSNVSIFSPR